MNENLWHRICTSSELVEGTRLGKYIKGQDILIFKIGNEIFAYEDRCPHAGAPLVDGRLHEGKLTCRHHQWQFDVRTGASIRPRGSKLKSYPTKIESGDIFVNL